MIEPITIRGNIRMTNYGQLIYNKNQEHFYTWHEELDYIIKEYPITNPIYEYSPHDMRFNVSTKTNISALTERKKNSSIMILGVVLCENGRQLKLHILIQTLRENTELHHTNGWIFMTELIFVGQQ